MVIVGGGPAGLACAIHLLQLRAEDPELATALGDVPVAVLEKGRGAGAHELSGAVLDPATLRELLPEATDWPHYGVAGGDRVHLLLSERRALRVRPVPPPFRNDGNVVVSVAELVRWLAERAEALGAEVLTETVGQRLLVSDGIVGGVRTGEKGRDRAGGETARFEPGTDVVARATVLADGGWGHLTGAAIDRFGLGAGRDPQVWALGVKEVWELERPLHEVVHTLGWPLRPRARHGEFGGAWLYGMNRPGEPPKASVGFVVGLDHADARLSAHDLLQSVKLHPVFREVLSDGRRVAWGAKTIPEGGWWAMPRLHAPGMVICGDAGGMVNVPKLKGLHYAIRAGTLAAERLAAGLKAGSSDFSGYDAAVRSSEIGRDLWEARNTKQAFGRGLLAGGALAGAMVLTRGRLPGGHWPTHPDAERRVGSSAREATYPVPDGRLTFDKLSSVYLSGLATRDDAPDHIRIQRRVPRPVAEAWAWMCPAAVYELPAEEDEVPAGGGAGGGVDAGGADATVADGDDRGALVDVTVHASNCVQCGAITAKGGRLTPPEGGDGPRYRIT